MQNLIFQIGKLYMMPADMSAIQPDTQPIHGDTLQCRSQSYVMARLEKFILNNKLCMMCVTIDLIQPDTHPIQRDTRQYIDTQQNLDKYYLWFSIQIAPMYSDTHPAYSRYTENTSHSVWIMIYRDIMYVKYIAIQGYKFHEDILRKYLGGYLHILFDSIVR